MKIRELIAILQQHDPEREVVMSSDAEGNHYAPLVDVSTVAWDAEEREIALEPADLTDERREAGFCEDDVNEDGIPAVVLYPL